MTRSRKTLLLVLAALLLSCAAAVIFWATRSLEESTPVEEDPAKVSLAEGLTLCAGEGVDLSSDARHCGACDVACSEGEFCADGSCIEAMAWREISAGREHTCGIRKDDTLWCWGRNEHGQVGQPPSFSVDLPLPLGEADGWTALSLGAEHGCALRGEGELWCWGRNDEGQLGDGSRNSRHEPVQIATETRWRQVSSGLRHSCAIDAERQVFCWGYNAQGQLGNGSTTQRLAPTKLDGQWDVVVAGSYYSCGLQNDGSLWCWGGSQWGHPTSDLSTTPVRVGESSNWVDLVAGNYHSCALDSAGARWCWGHHSGGRLGQHFEEVQALPVEIDPPAGTWDADSRWRQVALYGTHGCGLRDEGTLRCWGINRDGQLGVERRRGASRLTPAFVDVAKNQRFRQIAVGERHSCAIDVEGVLFCWGKKLAQTLEVPTRVENTAPEDVPVVALAEDEQNYAEFFVARRKALLWYRVESGELQRLRTIDFAHPVQDIAWVYGQGLAILTEEEHKEEWVEKGDGVAQEESDRAMVTRLCDESSQTCTTKFRRLYILPEDNLQRGALRQLDIFSFSGLPDAESNRDFYQALYEGRATDRASLFRAGEGELVINHCAATHYEDPCGFSSQLRVLPTLTSDRPGWPSQDPMGGRILREESGALATVELLAEVLSDEWREAHNFYCLHADGSATLFEGDSTNSPQGHGLGGEPPLYLRHDLGSGYTVYSSYSVLRACEEESHYTAGDDEFYQAPAGVWMIAHGPSWHIYQGTKKVGEFERGTLLLRPDEDLLELEEGLFRDPRLLDTRARHAWRNFHREPSGCDDFDYFPNGGMLTVYCRLKNHGSFGELEDALGMPVFRSGPHQKGALSLRSRTDFGRYNPDFVRTLSAWALPALKDSSFRQHTQPFYDRYLRQLSDVYWHTYQQLAADSDFRATEVQRIKNNMAEDAYFEPERYYRVLDTERYDPNITAYAVGFWLRRNIDGTEELFFRALRDLRRIYSH